MDHGTNSAPPLSARPCLFRLVDPDHDAPPVMKARTTAGAVGFAACAAHVDVLAGIVGEWRLLGLDVDVDVVSAPVAGHGPGCPAPHLAVIAAGRC